ncbi:MAG: metal ABC transporter solute-binding protein, Zn/Mn family, partial [Acidimicrobiales bacterium]
MGVVLALATSGAGCGSAGSSGQASADGSTKVAAVAAEDMWGSLLAQVAGDRVEVTSIIRDPAVDAHDYEAKPSDGVAVADARLVVVNGAGYDDWASKLVGANPSSTRVVVDVGEVVGAERGDSPHRWHGPDEVHRVPAARATALQQASPDDAAYFDAQAARLETEDLRAYDEAVARIRAAHAGTPIAV